MLAREPIAPKEFYLGGHPIHGRGHPIHGFYQIWDGSIPYLDKICRLNLPYMVMTVDRTSTAVDRMSRFFYPLNLGILK